VDFGNLKGRIAEALVENIFHLAGYRVARIGRESHVGRLVKQGADEFLPDFLAWKRAKGREDELHRLVPVEVKYRTDLAEFLRRSGAEILSAAKQQWPSLYFVLVTAHPDAGRACFQAVSLRDYTPGTEPTTVDLHELGLGIWPGLVDEHALVAQRLFSMLVSDDVLEQRQRQDEMDRWAGRQGSR